MRVNLLVRATGFELNGEPRPVWAPVARRANDTAHLVQFKLNDGKGNANRTGPLRVENLSLAGQKSSKAGICTTRRARNYSVGNPVL